MTIANIEKHYARLKWLASGDFTERDFDYKIKASDNPNGDKGEGGWSTMGDFENKMGNQRKELIISDAKRTLEIFIKKYKEKKNKNGIKLYSFMQDSEKEEGEKGPEQKVGEKE